MAASDWLQPQQLKLFMTGVEWQDSVTHSTDGPIPAMWPQKEAEASARGITGSMAKGGYQPKPGESKPTLVLEHAPNGKDIRTVQSEGHHRVAAAAALERTTGKQTFIPTNYVDNTKAGRKARSGKAA